MIIEEKTLVSLTKMSKSRKDLNMKHIRVLEIKLLEILSKCPPITLRIYGELHKKNPKIT